MARLTHAERAVLEWRAHGRHELVMKERRTLLPRRLLCLRRRRQQQRVKNGALGDKGED